MDLNRVHLIGISDADEEMREDTFFSSINIREIHTIIWRQDSLSGYLKSRFRIDFSKRLAWSRAESIYEKVKTRLAYFLEWVENGNSLIVLTSAPLRLFYEVGEDQGVFRIDDLTPFSWATWIRISGEMIEFCGPDLAREKCRSILEAPRYEVVFNSADLLPMLRVSTVQPGQPQLVGGYRRIGAGVVVFVPEPNWDDDQRKWGREIRSFLEALVGLPSCLSEGDPQLPPWAEAYCLPREADARTEIARLETDVTGLQESIAGHREKIAEAQPAKHLFTGTGDNFVRAVKWALGVLGFKVVEGPHPRADLLAWAGGRLAIIEAKGLDGPARENNLRQCERWRADVLSVLSSSSEERSRDHDLTLYADKLSELGVPRKGPKAPKDCKGMMVIGTFRKAPLADRTQPDFPDPAARAIARSPICALTGLQLLGLALEAMANSERKRAIVDTLLSTNGLLEDAPDWRAFLKTSFSPAPTGRSSERSKRKPKTP